MTAKHVTATRFKGQTAGIQQLWIQRLVVPGSGRRLHLLSLSPAGVSRPRVPWVHLRVCTDTLAMGASNFSAISKSAQAETPKFNSGDQHQLQKERLPLQVHAPGITGIWAYRLASRSDTGLWSTEHLLQKKRDPRHQTGL